MAATTEDLARARELRTKAATLRRECNTFGNMLAGTVESCSAAAEGMEELAAKLEAGATRGEKAAADVVVKKIGDARDVAGGTSLADLGTSIAKDLGKVGIGVGGAALGLGALWLATKVLGR